jgi:hypothetical protein
MFKSTEAVLQSIVLWDRRPEIRERRREAFRLFAEVGLRTSDRVTGFLARARLVLADGAVKAECDPVGFPVLASAERAIAEAVREVFGPAVGFRVLGVEAA